jgi:hypothetical protein
VCITSVVKKGGRYVVRLMLLHWNRFVKRLAMA